jgi:hypothetical protein
MARRLCNDRAAGNARHPVAEIVPVSRLGADAPGSKAQAVALHARPRFHPVLGLLSLLCLSLAGCASLPVSDSAGKDSAVDAVLPAGDGWRVFQLGTIRHALVSGIPEAWDGGSPANAEWLKLAAPPGPFRPVQAVPGQRGYFHLVDAASGRLCLYDAGAGLLSTFAMPAEFTPFPAGRAAVFRGADGAFTFLDYASGEAWQFADRQTADAGVTRWIPRGKIKLPGGLRDCAQPPGSTGLYCRGGDGSPLRFDGALNRVPAAMVDEPSLVRAVWDAGTSQWEFEGLSATGAVLFRYRPIERRWGSPGAGAPYHPSPKP